MYYINKTPNENGNYGNPRMQWFQDCLALPDDLLSDYLAAKGFVTITEGTDEQEGIITALSTAQEMLDTYNTDHPETEPEKETTVADLEEENKLLKAQVQAQTERSDFIEDCIAEMAGVIYAAGET